MLAHNQKKGFGYSGDVSFYSLSLKVLKCLDLFNSVVLFVKSEE